ncbi:EAL domain-containing protein [Pseudomonas sp. SWRI79]|uniref:EAL domain-containing protein n=1 Tax=Pseudomonas farris TaxID=2841207 RepID=A0ABS6PZP8_9PSED|nr:EAL domain-containing protein [Pseudomonas farris]
MKTRNVLLISNNALHREQLARRLNTLGPGCRCVATTGEQALAAVHEQRWDTLISDLEMPEITGLQLIDALAVLDTDTQLLLIGKQSPSIVNAIKEHARQKGVRIMLVNSNLLVLTDIERCFSAHASAPNTRVESAKPQAPALNAVRPTECLEQIVAYYQPQFHVASGELYGAEALARWDRQELGILGPLHLLPVLRSVKLRDALWERMLGHAMTLLEQLQGTDLCMAVNVSADVANSVSWAESVAQRVAQTRINPSRLTIEITEDTAERFDAGLAGAVSQLRLRGFNCAIDDFGTGFSSLQRLALTPFSSLKIDQRFVRQARSSSVGHQILANTIAMAHDLGLSVTAEGIETEADFERISKLGADIAQGYYFAKPMPAAEFFRYAQTRTSPFAWNA